MQKIQSNNKQSLKHTTTPTIRIATRESKLALWQANYVKTQLSQHFPELTIVIQGVTTTGDKILDEPLTKLGGKGLFVKELEEQLLDNQADIAVHSMKDVPGELPKGLEIGAVLAREDARDCLVSVNNVLINELATQAKVGTSSLRRQAQLAAMRQDLQLVPLRGNVDTRLKKLDAGDFDAIILAVAGLHRLQFDHRISHIFSTDEMLPAVGQGALGIECRKKDLKIKSFIASLNHPKSYFSVLAERSMNQCLGGNCQSPIAGYATINNHGKIELQGLVATPDGKQILTAKSTAKMKDAVLLGQEVAKALLALGAKEIIEHESY